MRSDHMASRYKKLCIHVPHYLLNGDYKQKGLPAKLKMPRLNLEQRNQILGLLAAGISQNVVAGRYNVSESTISRLVQRVNVTGTAANRPRCGAPRVTSVRQDNFIRQRHLRDRYTTAQATSNVVIGNRGQPIHRDTVINRLRERGIHCRRPVRCQALTRRHRLERQRWALNNRRRKWGNVVFSDESRFLKYPSC